MNLLQMIPCPEPFVLPPTIHFLVVVFFLIFLKVQAEGPTSFLHVDYFHPSSTSKGHILSLTHAYKHTKETKYLNL